MATYIKKLQIKLGLKSSILVSLFVEHELFRMLAISSTIYKTYFRRQSGVPYDFHWQADFTHVICCVIPTITPFTPHGLAPFTGIGGNYFYNNQ